MKLLSLLTASLMTLSLMGCCCGRNVVCDPCGGCNPCGGGGCDPCGGCRPVKGILRLVTLNYLGFGPCWNCGENLYGCGSFGGGCGGCGACGGCGGCGDMFMDGGCSSGSCGAPMGGGASCGCGSTSSFSPSAPMMQTPAYTPQIPSSPTPSSTAPGPAPLGEPTTMLPPKSTPQMQTVSYEEFQRLPGTVISGPGAGSTTSSTSPAMMPSNNASSIQRSMGSSAKFIARSANGTPSAAVAAPNQQAVWVPAPPVN